MKRRSEEATQAGVETGEVSHARRRVLTDQARERQDALSAAIIRLENAVVAPAVHRTNPWSESIATELALVRDAIRVHVEGIEESRGLFDEILADARFARRVEGLRDEHALLIARASALAEYLATNDKVDFRTLRREANELMTALSEHRATEADLIHEAFWMEIGAVD